MSGAEQKGPPKGEPPAPKPPKRTLAKSGDFDEGKRRVYEAALAEPDVLHFPPLNLPQRGRRTLNPNKPR